MKKYYVFYVLKDNELTPLEFIEEKNDDEVQIYGNAIFNSYIKKLVENIDEDKREEYLENYFKDGEMKITSKEIDVILPSWCDKPINDDYDRVMYLVVDNRIKNENAFLGLYVSEFDALNKVHSIISNEDLELDDTHPVYYKKLFKPIVKNVMPIGEPLYVKYDFEKMEFDV